MNEIYQILRFFAVLTVLGGIFKLIQNYLRLYFFRREKSMCIPWGEIDPILEAGNGFLESDWWSFFPKRTYWWIDTSEEEINSRGKLVIPPWWATRRYLSKRYPDIKIVCADFPWPNNESL